MSATQTGAGVDGRARRWDRHRAQRRQALLEAAVEAIETEGADAGVDAVAARAGVSRTVLYRYFDGRDDLTRAVSRYVVELLLARLVTPMSSARTPRRIIRGMVRAHLRWLDEHPELYRLIAIRSGGGAGAAAFAEGETILATQLADLLAGYMARLGLREPLAQPMAYGLIRMVEAAGDWWVRHRDEPTAPGQRVLVDTLSDSAWYVIDGHLRAHGITLDPDAPLPDLETT